SAWLGDWQVNCVCYVGQVLGACQPASPIKLIGGICVGPQHNAVKVTRRMGQDVAQQATAPALPAIRGGDIKTAKPSRRFVLVSQAADTHQIGGDKYSEQRLSSSLEPIHPACPLLAEAPHKLETFALARC